MQIPKKEHIHVHVKSAVAIIIALAISLSFPASMEQTQKRIKLAYDPETINSQMSLIQEVPTGVSPETKIGEVQPVAIPDSTPIKALSDVQGTEVLGVQAQRDQFEVYLDGMDKKYKDIKNYATTNSTSSMGTSLLILLITAILAIIILRSEIHLRNMKEHIKKLDRKLRLYESVAHEKEHHAKMITVNPLKKKSIKAKKKPAKKMKAKKLVSNKLSAKKTRTKKISKNAKK